MGSFFLDISQVIFTFMLDIHKLACNTGVSFSKQGIDIMKQQEIFDKAAVHLMGMEGPSLDQDNDACVYRGKDDDCEFNGQMCAVGLFIDDEHYDEDIEGTGITGNRSVSHAVAKSWGQEHLTSDQLSLLADLQMAHDEASRGLNTRISITSGDWSSNIVESLDGVATKFQLRFDPKGNA